MMSCQLRDHKRSMRLFQRTGEKTTPKNKSAFTSFDKERPSPRHFHQEASFLWRGRVMLESASIRSGASLGSKPFVSCFLSLHPQSISQASLGVMWSFLPSNYLKILKALLCNLKSILVSSRTFIGKNKTSK